MPTLYLFVGFPGSGKTTVAGYICEATGAEHIWADQERLDMFGDPTHSASESQQLYERLNRQTAELLKQGKSVVFDTNFNFRKDRDYLRQIAEEAGADVKLIWMTTSKEVAEHRAVHNSHQKPTRLFGNMEHATFQRIAGHLEPPTEDEHPIKVDGNNLDEAAVSALLSRM